MFSSVFPIVLILVNRHINPSAMQKGEVGCSYRTVFQLSSNYQQLNSDAFEVIPATGTEGFVQTLLTVFPNHILTKHLIYSVSEFMR